MGILNVKIDPVGQSGIVPQIIYIDTNDTLQNVLTPGYLNAISKQFTLSEYQTALVTTKDTPNSREIKSGFFDINYSYPNWSLKSQAQPGSVVLPTQADYIASFLDAQGTLGVQTGFIHTKADIVADAGNGYFSTAPAPGTGFLSLFALDTGSGSTIFINNDLVPENISYIIPNVGANSSGRFLAAAGAAPFIDGHFPVAMGTGGRMKDSGAKIIAGTTAVWGGGGTQNNFVIAGMTTAYVGAAVIRTSANLVSIAHAQPNAGILTVDFTADPGANTRVDYFYASAALA